MRRGVVRQVCSKRSWDGQVRKWRRMLHLWDPQQKKAAAARAPGGDEDADEASLVCRGIVAEVCSDDATADARSRAAGALRAGAEDAACDRGIDVEHLDEDEEDEEPVVLRIADGDRSLPERPLRTATDACDAVLAESDAPGRFDAAHDINPGARNGGERAPAKAERAGDDIYGDWESDDEFGDLNPEEREELRGFGSR